ncbi:transposase [Pseudomonas sp. MWU16-30317]|uniref:REP-associated tyrosine transposase n=1 Tax=Pseudomonas sp. MWU16-30317 TaxID=2878095 RepID=UPI001CFA8B6B|nr:transposase [Pseudomonas sp. MWU16-30317]
MPTRYESKKLRKGRYSETGRQYLITLVTANRERLFTSWRLAYPVIDAFKRAQQDADVESLCWVVMPDHLHWLIELKHPRLAHVLGRMKSRSTVVMNRLLNRTGPIWQKGFHDRALRREEDVKKVARYIVANPVRAGLVEKIDDYPMWDAVWL